MQCLALTFALIGSVELKPQKQVFKFIQRCTLNNCR